MAQWYLRDDVDVPYLDEFLELPEAPSNTPPSYKLNTKWLLVDGSDIPYYEDFITVTNVEGEHPEYKDFNHWLMDADSVMPYYPGMIDIVNEIPLIPPVYRDFTHWWLDEKHNDIPYRREFLEILIPREDTDAEVTLMHNKIIICDYIQRIKTDFEYVSKVVVDDL